MPLQKLSKNKTKNVLTQNWALEIFLISPHIIFQQKKGKDNILADSLSLKGTPQKNPGEK